MGDHSLSGTHLRLAVENLKRCPLCQTVNAKVNDECFVCRWHGQFDHEASSIEDGLLDILEHCPELLDCILHIPGKRQTMLDRIREWLRTCARPLDLEI